MEKRALRKEILKLRDSMSAEDHKENSKIIIEKLKNRKEFIDAKRIMIFVSYLTEVDTHEFIKDILKMEKEVIVPISVKEDRSLILSKLNSFDELVIKTYGILEPKDEFIRPQTEDTIDLVIVPGAVFDRKGYRVGYGGGYYDRFFPKLNENTPKIAIGFDCQVVDEVPIGKYDLPFDALITEKEELNF